MRSLSNSKQTIYRLLLAVYFTLISVGYANGAISCRNLFRTSSQELIAKQLSEIDLTKVAFTPVFDNDGQVVVRHNLQPAKPNQRAYIRRQPNVTQLMNFIAILEYRFVIRELNILLATNEYKLWLTVIQQLSMAVSNPSDYYIGTEPRTGLVRERIDPRKIERVFRYYGVLLRSTDAVKVDQLEFPEKSLNVHFKKHVTKYQEFEMNSKEEYLAAAREFWSKNGSGVITLSPVEGVYIKHSLYTYEYMVVLDSRIITYYRLTEVWRPELDFDEYFVGDYLTKLRESEGPYLNFLSAILK